MNLSVKFLAVKDLFPKMGISLLQVRIIMYKFLQVGGYQDNSYSKYTEMDEDLAREMARYIQSSMSSRVNIHPCKMFYLPTDMIKLTPQYVVAIKYVYKAS